MATVTDQSLRNRSRQFQFPLLSLSFCLSTAGRGHPLRSPKSELSLISMLSGQYVATAAAAKSTLRVLSLNTWGLNWPFSEDKWYRVRALRNVIALNNYDVILLQEVWFRRDYDIIRSAVPYASYFESFNQCSGYFLPMECSGLVILSRHRIEHVEFLPFRDGRIRSATIKASFFANSRLHIVYFLNGPFSHH